MLGQVDRGLVWFDGRQFWQILSALVIVAGTGTGAFILSYFTPTVGLGCRSGGFAVFGIISLTLLIAEFFIWFYTSPIRKQHLRTMVQRQISLSEQFSVSEKTVDFPGLATTKTILACMLDAYEALALTAALFFTRLVSRTSKHRRRRLPKAEHAVREHFIMLRALTARQWLERCFLQPLGVINTLWLCYLIIGPDFRHVQHVRVHGMDLGQRRRIPRLHAVRLFERSDDTSLLDHRHLPDLHHHGVRHAVRLHRVVLASASEHRGLRGGDEGPAKCQALSPTHVQGEVSGVCSCAAD